MKRFLALAALVLGLASCQTEPEGLDVNVGGAVDTTITVSIPETETRYGADSDSALGVFNNGVLSANDVTMRYIFQVYYNNGDQIVESQAVPQVKYSDETSVNFDVRLVPNRDYTFVVWADVVKKNDAGEWADWHYNTINDETNRIDLANITVIDNEWVAMDESRDAFTVAEPITNYTGKSIINLELKRPFAKLRVITTDMEVLNDLQIAPAYAEVQYTTPYRAGFNAVTSKAFEAEETDKITHRYEIKTYGDNVNDYSKVLFTDYFFANDAQDDEVNFVLSVYEDEQMQNLIKSNNFNTAIPARRNYLTTISGNVLTDGNNVKVDVVDAFENAGNLEGAPYYNEIVEVKSATELQKAIEAINNSTEPTEAIVIVLGENITLGVGASLASTRTNDINYALYLAEGKTATLDLNGKTLTTSLKSTDRHYYAIENHGALTIKDSGNNGAIVSRGIFNYGTLTLESGKIDACDHNGGYAVQCLNGAEFVMNGGTIVASNENGDEPTNGYDATTLRIEEGGKAIINDGIINNLNNYTFAIDNHGEVTVNGGTFTSIHSTVSTYGTMTIKGGSFTCNGLEGTTAHALVAWDGSETTINGGTFDGKDNYNGFNVDADEGAIVNINGGMFLSVHSGSLYGKGTINVKGGTFFDDPSARVVKGYVAEKNGDVFVVSKIALAENFADNSWDKIILACQNNIVPESWNVGDTKAMTIGKYTYDIAIIGKNHDVYSDGSGKAPLTLQLFQLYGTDAQMNETQDNTTGWSGSKMRNTTMEEIRSVMPDEVKNAIKAVDKVSLNGSKNALETTSDKLFLLSEKEVNGSEYYSGGYVEGARYAYYADQKWDSNGNLSSQIMKPSPNKDNKWTVSWYLRTPKNDKVDNTRFIAINGSGLMTHITAEIKSGLVFGFCF